MNNNAVKNTSISENVLLDQGVEYLYDATCNSITIIHFKDLQY